MQSLSKIIRSSKLCWDNKNGTFCTLLISSHAICICVSYFRFNSMKYNKKIKKIPLIYVRREKTKQDTRSNSITIFFVFILFLLFHLLCSIVSVRWTNRAPGFPCPCRLNFGRGAKQKQSTNTKYKTKQQPIGKITKSTQPKWGFSIQN